jgi:RNA polymerase sigma factor for flagellar operon FliA
MISQEDLWQDFFKTRDAELRQRLAVQYSGLVGYVVRGMPAVHQSLMMGHEDIIGYGTIGLLQAIDRFDPSRGVKFQTYALQRIRGAIIDALRSASVLSRPDAARVRAMAQSVERLTQERQHCPTAAEIAADLAVTVEEAERTLATSNISSISLERPIGNDAEDRSTLGDLLQDVSADDPQEMCEQNELRDLLAAGIRQLPGTSRRVVALHYIQELTPDDIAVVLGVSRSRVYQLRQRAIDQLRSCMQRYLRDGVVAGQAA